MSSKLSINQNQCINCKICVSTCPAKVFAATDNKVSIQQQKELFCINCGDCISVCPKEAISNSEIAAEDFQKDNINFQPEIFLDFLKFRRSVRSYKSNTLSEYEKNYLEQIASFVPKGGHTQSIRNTGIVIVENNDLIEKITDYTYEYMSELKKKLSSVWMKIPKAFSTSFRDNIDSTIKRIELALSAKEQNINLLTYNSPSLILLHCEKNNPISRENLTVMQYQLMLGAEALNLGTCFLGWVSFAMQSYKVKKSDKLKIIYDLLKIPGGRELSGVFSIGQKTTLYRKPKARGNAEVTVI
ncbi:MAG: nitroreductase family protein [Clostridia bacterium]|nr:nitroreductase family protein [Clostridia bacterium]